jgi:glycosyltransferase involved in cell wall biosynthesis
MQRLKIAHLARWLEVGGTEQVIYDLCRLGSEIQWAVAFNDGPMRAVFERAGIKVRIGSSPEHIEQLLAGADVINVHWLDFFPELLAAAQATGKPLVFTLHGCAVLPELPGLVLCTSRRVFDLQQHNLRRRVLIQNGVDTERFRPPAERRPGPVRIIRVCRPIRCAEYFWPAIHQVLQTCPETEVKLVGGPPFRLGRIESLGDRHDVAEQLAQADIFAYAPWPHEGTRDLVVLEAMATGLACVLSDVPCVRESVEDGVTGLLTPFGDAGAFAARLIELVRQPDRRQALGQRAAGAARELLDMRRQVELYQTAYVRALAEAAPAGQLNGTLLPQMVAS